MRQDRELFWSPRPGFSGEFEGKPVSINSLGLRGADVAVPKPRRQKRIACFGDSITFGYGASDDETYAARLAQALGSRVEVVNAGVTGYTSHQVLGLLRRVGGEVSPDVALFCIGWNDATKRPVDDRTYARSLGLAMEVEGVASYSYLYRAAKNLYLRRATREWKDPPRVPRVSLQRYRENLDAVVAFCRAHGTEPAFIDLPRRRRVGDAPFDRSYSAELRALASALRVTLIDPGELGLDTPLASNEKYFIDTLHFSREGHAYLAELLSRELVARKLFSRG